MADSIEVQLDRILDEYENLTKETVQKSANKSGRDAVQKLKNSSPKRPGGGEYAPGWSTKKTKDGVVVYNRKKPGLTHLLEKGHVIRNKYGTYGRAPAHVHIAPVADQGSSEFEENIRRELSR